MAKRTSRDLKPVFRLCQEYGVSELDERPDGTMRVVFGNPTQRAAPPAGDADGDEAGADMEDPRYFLERFHRNQAAANQAAGKKQ